jgi:hypothetical protein
MIALLATLASAKPPENLEGLQPAAAPPADALYDQLLGDATPEAHPAPLSLGSSVGGLWPLGVAAIGAGLVFAASRYRRSSGRPEVIAVVGRTSLGATAGLVVVDVKDPTGNWRRLLVGTGGTGAPTLVADLGEDEAEVDVPAMPVLPEPPPRTAALVDASRKAQARELIAEVVQNRLASR